MPMDAIMKPERYATSISSPASYRPHIACAPQTSVAGHQPRIYCPRTHIKHARRLSSQRITGARALEHPAVWSRHSSSQTSDARENLRPGTTRTRQIHPNGKPAQESGWKKAIVMTMGSNEGDRCCWCHLVLLTPCCPRFLSTGLVLAHERGERNRRARKFPKDA